MTTRKLTPNFSPAWSSSGFLLSSGLETTGKRSKSTTSQLISEITELEKTTFHNFSRKMTCRPVNINIIATELRDLRPGAEWSLCFQSGF